MSTDGQISVFIQKILIVNSGRRHTICITDKKEIIGFGLNSNGQLGDLDDQNIRLPVNICISCANHLSPRFGFLDRKVIFFLAILR